MSAAADATRTSDAAAPEAELLRRVRQIEITTNRLVDQGLAGDYHAAFKGRGIEFDEVRPYQVGDEVRAIDWNVTARMGSPYVKQFAEERDLTVFLLFDVSGSLGFGSRSITKRELAIELAAVLAFAALRNGDQIGAALVGEGVERFLPPGRRRNHVLHLVRELLSHPAGGPTDLETGLEQVVTALRRRAVLFIVSDFVEVTLGQALKAATACHDTILLEMYDPHDHAPPLCGPILLQDAETGRLELVDSQRALELRDQRQRERRRLVATTRELGVDHLTIDTRRPYLPELATFFARRRRRRTR